MTASIDFLVKKETNKFFYSANVDIFLGNFLWTGPTASRGCYHVPGIGISCDIRTAAVLFLQYSMQMTYVMSEEFTVEAKQEKATLMLKTTLAHL